MVAGRLKQTGIYASARRRQYCSSGVWCACTDFRSKQYPVCAARHRWPEALREGTTLRWYKVPKRLRTWVDDLGGNVDVLCVLAGAGLVW
jgi:hypothetical protein